MRSQLLLTQKKAVEEALNRVNQPMEFDEAVYSQVQNYTKQVVFRTDKFFTCDDDVDDYSDPLSPGAVVMKALDIPPERQQAFMKQYGPAIFEGVNAQRQNSQTALGKKVKGKNVACLL
jgi:hypothetical protein